MLIHAKEHSDTQQVAWIHATWPAQLDPSLQGDRMGFIADLEALVDALPVNIMAAACMHHDQHLPDPASDLALVVMQENLGWKVRGHTGMQFAQLDTKTIKQATAIQLGPLVDKRKEWHAEYAGVAIDGSWVHHLWRQPPSKWNHSLQQLGGCGGRTVSRRPSGGCPLMVHVTWATRPRNPNTPRVASVPPPRNRVGAAGRTTTMSAL
jgi:hypothetical protein